jgi:hypothetical protein
VQHVNIKIFASKAGINLVDAIPVFHRWIQENALPELLIDVADYKHVPDGPGIMLIGHEADYSLDETDGRLGLLYNRKKTVPGNSQEALAQAHNSAIHACKLLENESVFKGNLVFNQGDIHVILNDRLLFPNTKETLERLIPEITRYFDGVFGKGSFTLKHVGEPRDRFIVSVVRD